MKQLNFVLVLEDKEFEELKEKKGKLTWRSFILNLAKIKKRS